MHARIEGNVVAELFTPPDGLAIEDCFAPGLTWVRCPDEAAPGWLFDGERFSPPPPPDVPAPPAQLPPLTFINRFTTEEQNALAATAMSDAKLFLWFNRLTAAHTIDLLAPETKAGLDALAAAGVLTPERQTVVLTP